ncbi:hypothetical protein Syun_001025 [Stephania yunnanensis]|uniref:Uncharacterized protein n=1 Tax=Stephania yunnanensis TaxID=152371 RepID=A0AAP0LFV0_9MAGN
MWVHMDVDPRGAQIVLSQKTLSADRLPKTNAENIFSASVSGRRRVGVRERRRGGRKRERTVVRERLEAGFTIVVRGGTGGRSGGIGGDKRQQRQWYVAELTAVVRGGRTAAQAAEEGSPTAAAEEGATTAAAASGQRSSEVEGGEGGC